MQFLLTGIETHIDKGFGVTADAYYQSAEHLMKNHFESYDSTPQAEMPQNFLYRHAIELYLKSLIIIFHRKLKLDYGTVAFNSDEPEVKIDGEWRKLYTCHFIDKLYEYWLNVLFLPNIELLKKQVPEGDWQITENTTERFAVISKYDKDSAYFRYPITKNSSLDSEKYTVQRFKSTDLESMIKEIQEQKTSDNKGTLTMLLVDDNDNITNAFKHTRNILTEVRDALREVAYYFYCFHTMTRATLCSGM